MSRKWKEFSGIALLKWAALFAQCHLVKTLSRCIPIRQR